VAPQKPNSEKFKMIFGRLLLTEEGMGNLDIARQILRNDYNLVPPKNDGSFEDVLVWEDQEKIGRYRVHFYPHLERSNGFYDVIQFKYWMNRERMKREIFEQDPMNIAFNRVRASLLGKVQEETIGDDVPINEVFK